MFYHMNGDASVERTSLRPYLVVSAPSAGVVKVCETKTKMYRSRLETKNTCAKCILSMWDPSPPLSTKVDTDIIHVIKYTRPSPSVSSDQNLDGGKAWERG